MVKGYDFNFLTNISVNFPRVHPASSAISYNMTQTGENNILHIIIYKFNKSEEDHSRNLSTKFKQREKYIIVFSVALMLHHNL